MSVKRDNETMVPTVSKLMPRRFTARNGNATRVTPTKNRKDWQIARQDAILADPDLYARDPKAFDRAMNAAEKARTALENAELEWLELEEKKAALGA